MAISLSKTGNAIKFTFENNAYYLSNGVIEVPLNSLTLVTDDSDMFTFKKSATNDVFISGRYSDIGMTKSELESYYKENMVGSTGGGGVTSGEVQTMIDESISGKADTSDVQEIASDVSTVSGDVNTLSGSVESLTGSVNTLSGDVSTLSGQVETDEKVTANALVDLDNRKLDASAYTPTDLSNYYTKSQTNTQINNATEGLLNASTFNTYSASTEARIGEDEEVTSAALNELNEALSGKQDTLIAGTNITISGNVISAEGGTVDQAFDKDSTNAIANSAVTRNTIGSYGMGSSGGKSFLQAYDQKGYGIDKLSLGFSKINGREIAQVQRNIGLLTNFDLVETSAITSSVTSASTDSEIPSAKAVYDALQEGGGGGGLPESAFTTYTASTDARLAEDEEVTAAGLNALNDALSGKQDTLSAGTNITISGNVISAEGGGATYTAGRGIDIDSGNTISFSLPISAGTGQYSVIEGQGTSAMTSCDHAEGKNTYAKGGSGYPAHAEGERTSAMTYSAHAEGRLTKANGECSHAEGKGTETSGEAAHVEGGWTKAVGNFSHAEGNSTSAMTYASHAEGFSTIAKNESEHASGQYNNSVSASTSFGVSGNTLFSVGNGNSTAHTHNAIEIRQNGDVYIPNTDDTTSANYYEKPMVRLQDVYGALGGLKLVQISQSDYDNLQNKDASTLYIITNNS